MKKYFFLLMFALPAAFGFTPSTQPAQDLACSAPTNAHKTFSASGAITFAWDAMSGAVEYKLYYVKQGGSPSSYFYTTNTNYAFTGLAAGNYSFYFATVCDGGVSSFIVIEDHIML
jgi:hypothetical protein